MSLSSTRIPQRADLSNVACILLAGGKGTRLHELTQAESKPAVMFAGRNRIIDFAMANAVRSGIETVTVATQFAPQTLHAHLPARWGNHFGTGGLSIHDGKGAFEGTADAVRKLWTVLQADQADEILVLAADHVYDMDYGALIAHHRASRAEVSIAVDVVPQHQASGFGVMAADENGWIKSFLEKPKNPPSIPGEPGSSLVSMGIYVFSRRWLASALDQNSLALDFGHDIISLAVDAGAATAFRLPPAPTANAPYWRDVGTLDALRLSQLDFIEHSPARLPNVSPAGKWSIGRGSVAMAGASIGAGARISNAIIAPGTAIPAGMVIGEDRAEDCRWFRVSAGGTVLVTQAMIERRHELISRKSTMTVPGSAVTANAEMAHISGLDSRNA